MSTSISPPPPKPSNSDMDLSDDDYESEYEEIEVEEEVEEEIEVEEEEEIEVEEEEDEEEEEEVEDEEEELGGGGEVENVVVVEREKVEEEGEKVAEEAEKVGEKVEEEGENVVKEEKVEEEDGDFAMGEDLTPVREEENHENGESSSRPNDPEAPLGDHGEVGIKQLSPRLDTPSLRLRTLSSSPEFDGENKRPKIVCEFYAKGWCIKGNSCRFLHIKEGSDAVVKKSEVEREASSSVIIASQQSGGNSRLNEETEKLVVRELDACHKPQISTFVTPFEEMFRKGNTASSGCWPGSYSHSMQTVPFGSSVGIANALRTHNILESSTEHRASISSLHARTPVFSGSETVFRSRDRSLRNTEPANCWEPSVPFRPSHVITRNLLYKENLYGSLRDSIDQPDVRDGQVNFTYSAHGSSTANVHLQTNIPPEEDTRLSSAHVDDTRKDDVMNINDDAGLNFDKPRHKAEPKTDGSVYGASINSKKVGQVQNEPKPLKYFRVELVEFVKELMKPTWREGLLSRDAYKVIVKKAVDKVISTLEPHQIPSSPELVQSYLSSSQQKLTTLLEGYIGIYGKVDGAE